MMNIPAKTKGGTTLTGALLVGAMLLMLLTLAVPHQAWASVESEPNNSFGSADVVKAKEWVYGWNDGSGTGDVYKVTLPSAGTMTFWFASMKAYDTMNTHGVIIYDKNHRHVASGNFYQNTTASDYIVPTRLSAGTYYIEVDNFVGYGVPYADHPYAFYVDYSFAGPKVASAKAGKGKFTVKWGKASGAAKYQVRYSTNKSMKGAKSVTVSRASASKTIKAKAKKKYYVQVRVAKTANGKTYWSTWSSKKAVTTK